MTAKRSQPHILQNDCRHCTAHHLQISYFTFHLLEICSTFKWSPTFKLKILSNMLIMCPRPDAKDACIYKFHHIKVALKSHQPGKYIHLRMFINGNELYCKTLNSERYGPTFPLKRRHVGEHRNIGEHVGEQWTFANYLQQMARWRALEHSYLLQIAY